MSPHLAKFDLVVLGGGPAGTSGALAAGLIGRKVALVEKAAIVGWSDGGEIALKLGIHHPTRVTKLFVFGASYDETGAKPRKSSRTFAGYTAKCRADYVRLSKTPSAVRTGFDAMLSQPHS